MRLLSANTVQLNAGMVVLSVNDTLNANEAQ